jgi:hypothetical protein
MRRSLVKTVLLVGLLTMAHFATGLEPGGETRALATAREKLAQIEVRRESHQASYDRDRFRHWIDADRDCEDTRAEVLRAESSARVTRNSSCTIQTGRWFSLYDGITITQASSLDVDHVVALAEAWRSGAWAWSDAKREAFANDISRPQVLRAVTASTNRSKGDRDPTDWLPTRRAAWCRYAREWIHVKYVWDLSAQRAEIEALEDLLATC